MFILSNIKAKTSELQLFQSNRRKYLKFQTENQVKKHPFPSLFINSHSLQWSAEMSFPENLYNHTILFELYELHNFGYNTDELDGIIQGKIKIDKDMDSFSSQLRMVGNTKIVGYLSGSVRHKTQTVEKIVEKKIAIPQILIVKSIVAHIPLAINKKILMRLSFGKKQLKTKAIKTFCGDLVFAEPMQSQKLDVETKGTVSVWELQEDSETKLGQGLMDLVGNKPNKRVLIYSQDNKLLGQAYVDALQEQKQEMKKKSNSLPSHLHKISKLSPKKIMETTSMSRMSVGFKKVSAVHTNQSIVFPTEKRFKQTGNPEVFSEIKAFRRSKMPPSQFRANKIFNKGIGLTVIPEQQSPGVGEYSLPSIWDRY